jgi:hypothetical protein
MNAAQVEKIRVAGDVKGFFLKSEELSIHAYMKLYTQTPPNANELLFLAF